MRCVCPCHELIKCDACPESKPSARTSCYFPSYLGKAKSTQEKGNLEDSNCATRVSREKLCRLLCFLLAAFCARVFFTKLCNGLQEIAGQAVLWGRGTLPPGPCCPEEGTICRGRHWPGRQRSCVLFPALLPSEREVLPPFFPNAAYRVL